MTQFIRIPFAAWCTRYDLAADVLDAVLDGLPSGAWIAGGALRRTLIKAPLDSDFDFFFRSEEALAEWESKLPETMKLVAETQHHKQWRGSLPDVPQVVDVQAIRFRFYETAQDVIDSFDYTITQFVLDGEDLVTTPEALWDLGRRRLAIHKVTYPVATMRRMLKYTKQGFTACAGCMKALLTAPINNPNLLDQLDVHYVD